MFRSSHRLPGEQPIRGVYTFEGVDYWYKGSAQDESYIGTEIVAVGQTAVKTILIPKADLMAVRR